jgi:MFS family permease
LAGYVDFWLLVIAAGLFNITIMLDSASLTAGTVESASTSDRGALLAVHSMVGFGGGALGGPVAGWLLDQNGGEHSLAAWAIAMGLMGVGSFTVSILMHQLMRSGADYKPTT